MDADTLKWAIGVLVTLIVGFFAVKKVIKSRTQTARADRGSTVIQSGRDTKIE